MSEKTIPIKGSGYVFTVCLSDQANPFTYKSAPTLAAGDVKVDKDGGGLNNLNTLPSASGKLVTVTLSATEMTADEVTVVFSDAAGAEWCDLVIVLHPTQMLVLDGTAAQLTANAIELAPVGAGTPVMFAPTSVVLTQGDNDLNATVETTLATHDDVYIQAGENTTNGLDWEVRLASSTASMTPSAVRITGFYNGSASHSVAIEIWNYTTSAWEVVGTMLSRTTMFDYTVPAHAANQDGSGAMKIRFLHNTTTYNGSHYVRLDYVAFEKVNSNSQMASDIATILTQVNDMDLEIDGIDTVVDAIQVDTTAILIDTGTTLDGIVDAIKAKTDLLGTSSITTIAVSVPVASNSGVTTYQSDDYYAVDARSIIWTSSAFPSLIGATIEVHIDGLAAGHFDGAVTDASTCYLELTAVQSATIPLGVHEYQLIATLSNTHMTTLVEGSWLSLEKE